MTECPVCSASVARHLDTMIGELKSCTDCGTELEVTSLDPFTLVEAPQEEEDWGE